jgi:hypothetical protein
MGGVVGKGYKWSQLRHTRETYNVVVFYGYPDTNWKTSVDQKMAVTIMRWGGGLLPDRGSAYAYQTGLATFVRDNIFGGGEWQVEPDTLSPMVYFGQLVSEEDGRYCKDDRGNLHGPLEEGETIEPVSPGTITVTHSGGHRG